MKKPRSSLSISLYILTSKDCKTVIVNVPLYNYFDTTKSLLKVPVSKREDQKNLLPQIDVGDK